MAGLLIAPPLPAAQETNGPPVVSDTVVTNMAQFWELPQEKKSQLHRIQMKLLIYYCDPIWDAFWGASDNLSTFLPFRGLPVSLKPGDNILIDGLVFPANQKFLWDKTSIKILSESNAIPSVSVRGKLLDFDRLDKQFVELEVLVESQRLTSSNVLQLGLLAENFNLNAFVHLDDPGGVRADLTGKFVRIRGVYGGTPDAFGHTANITLWTPGLNFVKTIGLLENDSRFSIPVTSSENLAAADPKVLVRVEGVVRSQQLGEAVTIWDDAGQVRVLAKQRSPLQQGDHVEAIGHPAFQGMGWVLQEGLFRLAAINVTNGYGASSNQVKLRLADQVRGLDKDRIVQRPPVSIEGVVTWADSQTNFIFILDSSDGIRVMQSQLQSGRRIQVGMRIKVEGNAAMGDFAPVITNAIVLQTGNVDLPDAPLISFEQALTGTEDGRWIQVCGYVRKVTEVGKMLELQLVAPGGEFTAHVARDSALRNLQGSVVLVRGVCIVTANSRRQLTGVEIWSAVAGDVQIEQSAPEDLFAPPMRSLAGLRQFNLYNTLNERVHTCGAVTLHVPGRYLYVQEDESSILALSDQLEPVHVGDRVEIVGFPGNENGNFLLREAVYRRTASGFKPVPVQLPASQSVKEELDGLLVQAEGVLLDIAEKSGEMRLIIQARGLVFEAKLDPLGKSVPARPALGSKLAVTGVYRIQRDEHSKPHSFLLNLRDANDVRVLAPPPWWTLPRLLLVLAGVLLASLLGLLWTLATRRKNSLLLQAQAELKAGRDKLEERVQERTRELREQIKAREHAHAELSGAQEELKRSEERFGKAFRASPVPLTLQSVADQRYMDVNKSFLRLTGFKLEDVLGHTPAELKLFAQAETLQLISDAIAIKQPARNLQGELRTRDGRPLTVLISTEIFELENQPHFLTSLQDITERVNIENQLRQAQKMEVVGQIAAGISHDFNNILTVIQGHAGLQLSAGHTDASLVESLNEVARASVRASSLTRQLLAFSRKQMLHRRPLDLREALNNLGKMLQRIIGEHIYLRMQCAENLPLVFADAVNFEQIIINLAVNARDAMPRGGPLTIAAEPVVIDEQYKQQVPDAIIGTFVRLTVADKGSGMDTTVRSKIFEPFFTTKDVGKGTGMGLATVYGIVKQHQGWIEVESQVHVGSVFKVFLPLANGEAQKSSESGTDLIHAADVEPRTILVVEDEAPLREMASKILKRLGYRVVVAQDGPEALTLWPQHRGKIDLLFTDMVMPGGMTGRELADRLLREEPRLRVIYSTGYSADLFSSGIGLVEGVNCLFKPYDATTLVRTVKKAFAPSQPDSAGSFSASSL
jgi:two-component system cell cycle sensor histidine kinase/response regulator CckA